MNFRAGVLLCITFIGAIAAPPISAAAERTPSADTAGTKSAAEAEGGSPRHLSDAVAVTQGSVTVGGRRIGYRAEAGVMVVYLKDPLDEDPPPPGDAHGATPPPQPPEAGMSYVAYFLGDKQDARRPITFLFNGGPGASTVWLHMGSFGPKRVVIGVEGHAPAAPYRLIDNEYSLIESSDLVFVDAPGTGFGHLRGTDKEKAFFGVDQDAHAFANFIVEFLSRHGRWNSPKYLFGESYGTLRAAVLASILQTEQALDLNGVILLSQALNYDFDADTAQFYPGADLSYVLALPTYAATAWYHRKLPHQPDALEPLLREVENFALTDYAQALAAGTTLSAERKSAIAAQLQAYTGVATDYFERADLRVNTGEFAKNLLGSETTTGHLDTRFTGPTLDPMSKEAEYDPLSAAISSAYVSAFNDYVRNSLKFGEKMTYKADADIDSSWDYLHRPPGARQKLPHAVNAIPDLAAAMKENPKLKVQVHGGYYDLTTPYFDAIYEVNHLGLQPDLRGNIEMHFYETGHMVYVREPGLKALHANVAAFIDKTKAGMEGR
jgi:carboxypeptidase C (cathepsin A)